MKYDDQTWKSWSPTRRTRHCYRPSGGRLQGTRRNWSTTRGRVLFPCFSKSHRRSSALQRDRFPNCRETGPHSRSFSPCGTERCGLCLFGKNSHGLSYKLSYAGPFDCFYTELTQFHFSPFVEKGDWKVSDSGVAVSTFRSLFGDIVYVRKRFQVTIERDLSILKTYRGLQSG